MSICNPTHQDMMQSASLHLFKFNYKYFVNFVRFCLVMLSLYSRYSLDINLCVGASSAWIYCLENIPLQQISAFRQPAIVSQEKGFFKRLLKSFPCPFVYPFVKVRTFFHTSKTQQRTFFVEK